MVVVLAAVAAVVFPDQSGRALGLAEARAKAEARALLERAA